MANYSSLKNALAQVIKPNDNQEITGQIMQDALMAMINALGAGYQFAGVPTAQTDPSTPDQNVFYIAGAGTYPNFGGTVVPRGSVGVFRYNGEWNYTVIDVASWADASNKLYYNTQAGNVAAKTIQADGFTLQPGGWIKIHFDNANTVDNPTLNINNTGAHTMTFNGRTVSATNSWKAGETVAFYYDNYGVGIWHGIRLVEYPDFINVNELVGQTTPFASASAARSAIPQQNRKPGLNISYLLSTGENTSQWQLDMFIGDDVTDWGVADNWKVIGPVSVSQNTLSIGGNYAGEVSTTYDVTLHNNGTTFDSLEALLSDANLNTLIPLAVRKGGMSIKFVRSSDNKYVQYRYMETDATTAATFTNVANWQKELTQSGGNVVPVLPANSDLPNFDTTNMTFTWPSSGGFFCIGNQTYSLPSFEGRTVSLSGIASPAIFITFNISNSAFDAKAANATLSSNEVVIAVVRTDAASTPTQIYNVSASFAYTIDGINVSTRVKSIEYKIPTMGDILIENMNEDNTTAVVNIDTATKKFQLLGIKPKIIVNNKIYIPVQTELSLSDLGSRQIFVVFNISTLALSALSYQAGLTIPNNCVVIAIIFVDVAGNFTEVQNVTCSVDYTVDGKRPVLDKLEKAVNSKANVILVYDAGEPPTLPNFDTEEMTFTLSSHGGFFFIGNKGYSFPELTGRTISLLGVNSVAILLVYNIKTHAISAKAHNATLDDNDVVFAVVRVDTANTPTKITAVSCDFDYTINGVNIIRSLVSRIGEIKNETIVKPYMAVFKSIPDTEINTEFQSLCKVGNEFWIASGGSGQAGEGTLVGYIYRYDMNWNYIDKIAQQGFHFNSMSYDEVTDRLITGQAGDSSKDIYIFGNVSSWPTIHASSPITSSDIERTITISQVSNRPNPVWAERNALGNREIIISANLNSKFIKIKLGYGTNQLTNGNYTASANGVPNGTYDIVWNESLTIPQVVFDIANKLPSYPTAVCQDIDFYKGKIYVMATATPTTLMEITKTDNGLKCRVINQLWCDDSDDVITNCANEGIMHFNGNLYCGIAAIGMSTTITNYNNKILKFEV